ncbi:hypothetical protein ACFFV7_46090 [Nonomuraea spiralis]|uniref:Uncharacterized protein n=1 Tax=Nonomuraea spiralis TaxID=46182 RepID=A0ABV5IVM5_9ACTN|nr:hypothetical protein [Nonomuraea spiralis]GGS83874.1 hypothetical protein GCM10010176_029370 [Nonomuraea spiralis]
MQHLTEWIPLATAAATRDRHRRPTDHGESNTAHPDPDRTQGPVDR